MLHDVRGLHCPVFKRLALFPAAHAFEIVDFDGIVIAAGGNLAHAIERSMADAQSTHMRAQQRWYLAVTFPKR